MNVLGLVGEVGWARKSILGSGDSICQGPEVEGTKHFEELIGGLCGWRMGGSGGAVTQAAVVHNTWAVVKTVTFAIRELGNN